MIVVCTTASRGVAVPRLDVQRPRLAARGGCAAGAEHAEVVAPLRWAAMEVVPRRQPSGADLVRVVPALDKVDLERAEPGSNYLKLPLNSLNYLP